MAGARPRRRKPPAIRRCGWCADKFKVPPTYPQQGTCSHTCKAQKRYHEGRSGITPGSSPRAVPAVEVQRTPPSAPSEVDLMWPHIQEWIGQGLTYAAIGRRCGVTGKTVREWALDRGSARPVTPRGKNARDAKVMARKLWARDVPVTEIARRVGRSRMTVYRWCSETSVEVRSAA